MLKNLRPPATDTSSQPFWIRPPGLYASAHGEQVRIEWQEAPAAAGAEGARSDP
jgi:hypothetical protein